MIWPDVQYPHWNRVLVDERLLQRVESAVALEPFDGGDLGAVVHHRQGTGMN